MFLLLFIPIETDILILGLKISKIIFLFPSNNFFSFFLLLLLLLFRIYNSILLGVLLFVTLLYGQLVDFF